jgi:hypothetical protein
MFAKQALPSDDASSAGQCPFSHLFGGQAAQDSSPAPRARIVLGDRLKSQLPDDQRLISISDAEALLTHRDAQAAMPPLALHLGQGIAHERMFRLYAQLCGTSEPDPRVTLVPGTLPAKADQELTHKQKPHNVAISVPREHGDGTYAADLLIDEHCADMSDHLTGQHIPGMVIAEAARQMMIAVTEKFFILTPHQAGLRFVTHQMSVTYHDFVLPFPVTLRLIPLTLRRAGDHNLTASCDIRFMQSDRVVACATFSYSVVDKRYLESREGTLIERWLDEAVDAVKPMAA